MEKVRGFLVLRIEEASGRTKKDEFVWDTNVESEFQAFVKGGCAVWVGGCASTHSHSSCCSATACLPVRTAAAAV